MLIHYQPKWDGKARKAKGLSFPRIVSGNLKRFVISMSEAKRDLAKNDISIVYQKFSQKDKIRDTQIILARKTRRV